MGAVWWLARGASMAMLVTLLWRERPYYLDLLSHFPMHFAALLVLLGFLAAAANRPKKTAEAFVIALVIVAVAQHSRHAASLPAGVQAAPGAHTLRIVTYNAKWTKDHDDEAFVQWLRAQNADLISLFAPPWPLLAKDQWLREVYPHRVEPESGAMWMTVLLSKTPVEVERIGERSPETQRSFVARRPMLLTLDDGRLLLFTGMRPPSPRTRSSWRLSLDQVERDGRVLREFHEHTGAMIIAAGDFNSTPTGRVHHTFARNSGLKAWTTPVGAGTWPSWAPTLVSLPIDRVWVSEGLRIRTAQVGPVFGSDHRPVVFEIELPSAGAPAERGG